VICVLTQPLSRLCRLLQLNIGHLVVICGLFSQIQAINQTAGSLDETNTGVLNITGSPRLFHILCMLQRREATEITCHCSSTAPSKSTGSMDHLTISRPPILYRPDTHHSSDKLSPTENADIASLKQHSCERRRRFCVCVISIFLRLDEFFVENGRAANPTILGDPRRLDRE
jgi:hypothetical protein